MIIHLVNKKTHKPTPNDIFIGRGSPLGNPYDWRGSPKALYVCSNRREAIENYEKWLDAKVKAGDTIVLNELRKIYRLAKKGDVSLVCYCSPLDCHGRVIREFILKQLEKVQ